MTISVVICAYTTDRWDALVDAVRSSVEQTHAPDEVVLVIDYNDELFERATRELTGARVVANRSTKGLSGARNTGVVASSGDVVMFLDDDAYADPRWIEEMTAPLDNPNVVGVGGWIVPHWETPEPSWFPQSFYWILGCSYEGLPLSNELIRNPIGASMAIRRRVFASVGGFTSGIGRIGVVPLGCEETELCIRYTKSHPSEFFVMRREAVVRHRVPSSRLTWHYFWTRCWAEGLSKAAVSSLVGSSSGLAAERRHVLRTLPLGFLSDVRQMTRAPSAALARMGLVVAGTSLAFAGLVRGHAAIRKSPIQPGVAELNLVSTTDSRDGGERDERK
jgi:GT2 family glycosyltransferase